ncbi:MAG: alpha/beta hydrolase-fold protein [Fluviicola sp.]
MTRLITIFLFFVGSVNSISAQKYERYKKLIDTTIFSKSLGFEKKITITVPVEWQKDINRDFPLILIFDQQNQRSHNYIINTVDYLTSNEQMPSSIMVSIESDETHRLPETLHKESGKNGLARENEQFLFDELIPLLEKKYKANSFRVFVGHSRFGYFTTSLLSHRINELNAVIAISPFFSQENVNLVDSIASLSGQIISNKTFFRFAIGGDFPKDYYKMDSLIKTLSIQNFDAKGTIFPQADHNVTPGLTIATSLYEVFEYWSKNQNNYLDNYITDLNILDSLEKVVTSFYGKNLKFSLGVLNGKGWYYYGEEQYENAIKAWEILLKSYPNFSEGYMYIIEAQKLLKVDYSKNVLKLKESLKSSTFYTNEEKKEIENELEKLMK